MSDNPRTLLEAIKYFADIEVSHQTLVELRWPNGVCCPTCGRTDVRYIATRRLWECKEKHPQKQFSARVGTLFEDSPLGLDIWFAAIWQIANCKNGISSYEFARAAGITQKSAWFVLHRVRAAMEAGSILTMEGTVEADETFLGGLAKNMHQRSKRRKESFGPTVGKQTVAGILRRKGAKGSSKVKAAHVPDTKKATLHKVVKEAVAPARPSIRIAGLDMTAFPLTTSMRLSIMPSNTCAEPYIQTGSRIIGRCLNAPSKAHMSA